MEEQQQLYDDAMFDFTMGEYDSAIAKLKEALSNDPENFDAQLALGMAFYRKGDFQTAIVEGHKAEALRPNEQWVHTNLSLFYVKLGDKQKAEHHGLQARLASWKGNMAPPDSTQTEAGDDLKMSKPPPPPMKPPTEFPEMPWKKKKKIGGSHEEDGKP